MTLDLGTPVASAACATLVGGWNKAQPLGTELPGPLGQPNPNRDTGHQHHEKNRPLHPKLTPAPKTDPCTQIQLHGMLFPQQEWGFHSRSVCPKCST